MSADLLAEFDSFYQAPSKTQPNATPASNDLSFLGNTSQPNPPRQGGSQWQSRPTQEPSADIWGNMGGFQSNTNHVKENTSEDDGWGSFEAFAEPAPVAQQPPPQSFVPMAANYGGFAGSQSRGDAGIIRRPTMDLFSKNIHTLETTPNLSKVDAPPSPQRPPPVTNSSFENVLFDAGNELDVGDEEDFGDFESVTSPEPPAASHPPPSQSLNQLFETTSLESKPQQATQTQRRPANLLPTSPGLPSPGSDGSLPYPQAPKSPSFQERNPFRELGLAVNQVGAIKKSEKQTSASPITAWPTFASPVVQSEPFQDSPVVAKEEDEDWGTFADMPPNPPAKKPIRPTSGIEADAWGWDEADNVSPQQAAKPADVPPPTNVPPPSVLLTLFPPLFDLPQQTLFKGVVNQPFSLKNRILSDTSTVNFLRAYLLISVVAARVIAGRKLRWKRDTILSQSMKIGQAGGKGGMKLTGVDKAETTREDREAAEVVRVWKDQVGRLKSAIAVANTSIKNASQHLQIPDITETMHVKAEPGGLTAPKACVICGLKREERIAKVDVGVEDSFGEWWVEHWGHRACKNLWEENEGKLKHH